MWLTILQNIVQLQISYLRLKSKLPWFMTRTFKDWIFQDWICGHSQGRDQASVYQGPTSCPHFESEIWNMSQFLACTVIVCFYKTSSSTQSRPALARSNQRAVEEVARFWMWMLFAPSHMRLEEKEKTHLSSLGHVFCWSKSRHIIYVVYSLVLSIWCFGKSPRIVQCSLAIVLGFIQKIWRPL